MNTAPGARDFAALRAELATSGLMPLGGFVFREGDDRPAGPSGVPAAAIVLIGHVGSSFWPYFTGWRKGQDDALPDPLDTWSKAVIGAAADRLGLRAVFPSDRPWLPFQQWAMRAQGIKPSPLGLLIHPRYGLWQAFRGALVFDRAPDDLPAAPNAQHPCDLCVERPCLSACPVGAFDGARYDVAACRSHVAGPGGARCLTGGCLARLACPVGREFAYLAEQQAFHMAAFATG